MRGLVSVLLAGLLIVPMPLQSAPSLGSVQGTVTVDGRPLKGVELTLVDVASGKQHTARSGADGQFTLAVAPGSYVVTNQGRSGLAIGRAPAIIAVEAGRIASTNVDLVAVAGAMLQQPPDMPTAPGTPPAPGAEAPAPPPGTVINHDPVSCLVAGEFPMLDADVQPSNSVARVRLYFKSALSEFYYSDMQPFEGHYRGWMPKPTQAASPITYYIEATTTEYGEARTSEVQAEVVASASECKGKVAPIGQPPAGLTFFSAASGAVVVPAGFAVGGLAALGVGTAALLAIGGAAAIATTIAVVNNGASPSPAASVPPPASPSPTPRPTPEPSPSPSEEPPPPPPVSPFR